MLEITVEVKKVFGHDKVYPVCKKALIFARIAKTETLTPDSIRYIKRLGYEINIKMIGESFGKIGG